MKSPLKDSGLDPILKSNGWVDRCLCPDCKHTYMPFPHTHTMPIKEMMDLSGRLEINNYEHNAVYNEKMKSLNGVENDWFKESDEKCDGIFEFKVIYFEPGVDIMYTRYTCTKCCLQLTETALGRKRTKRKPKRYLACSQS